jgi:hypothetical protein
MWDRRLAQPIEIQREICLLAQGLICGRKGAVGTVIFAPLAHRGAACDNGNVRARPFLNLLIALSVAAGLVSLPLAAAAHANAGPPVVTSSDEMQAMGDDMPCCPHEQKSKDCQDCAMLCLVKSTQISSASAAIAVELSSIHAVLLGTDDANAEGLERPPPDHPPRILV